MRVLLVVVMVASGCAPSFVLMVRDDRIERCEGHLADGIIVAQMEVEQCVAAFERQGFTRQAP